MRPSAQQAVSQAVHMAEQRRGSSLPGQEARRPAKAAHTDTAPPGGSLHPLRETSTKDVHTEQRRGRLPPVWEVRPGAKDVHMMQWDNPCPTWERRPLAKSGHTVGQP